MKKLMIAALFVLGCTDDERARETLEKSGYTDIQVGGYDHWAYSEDDSYSTKFRAKNPQGTMVEGTVCCGTFKSCTVRF